MSKQYTSICLALASLLTAASIQAQSRLENLENAIYRDVNLFLTQNQTPMTCRSTSAGFCDPENRLWPALFEVSGGSIAAYFGRLNAGIAAYGGFKPIFHHEGELNLGGLVWDDRATRSMDVTATSGLTTSTTGGPPVGFDSKGHSYDEANDVGIFNEHLITQMRMTQEGPNGGMCYPRRLTANHVFEDGDPDLPANLRVQFSLGLALGIEPVHQAAIGLFETLSGWKDLAISKEDIECLALNVYHEARSEPEVGQTAVAAVTLNRVFSGSFPDSVCGVVKQGGQKLNRCQFSWWCDGKKDTPNNPEAWDTALRISRLSLEGKTTDPTNGALFYHASYVKPRWSRKFERTAQIGAHIFYRPKPTEPIRVASVD